MIAAWDVRKRAHTASVEHSVRDALNAAAVLNHKDVDVAQMVFIVAQRMPDPKQRAALLSRVAHVLTEAGRPEEGLKMLIAALEASSIAGRDTVRQVLADGAATLAAIDGGDLLWKLYHELERVDNWFAPSSPPNGE
jgi:hypothetical protein